MKGSPRRHQVSRSGSRDREIPQLDGLGYRFFYQTKWLEGLLNPPLEHQPLVLSEQMASEVLVIRPNKRDINFLLLISLPLVIAAMGMMWDTSTMLDGISVSVDRQEQSRTWQAVQSAVGAAEERLAGTVRDNAHWDDAVTQTYGPIDAEWMFTTWGVVTTDINFDTVYVVDAKGKVLYSSHEGVQSRFSPQSYFGDALQRMLNTLLKNGMTFDSVSTLVNTPDGLGPLTARCKSGRRSSECPSWIKSRTSSLSAAKSASSAYYCQGSRGE